MGRPSSRREVAYDKAVKLVLTHGKTLRQTTSIAKDGTNLTTLSRSIRSVEAQKKSGAKLLKQSRKPVLSWQEEKKAHRFVCIFESLRASC